MENDKTLELLKQAEETASDPVTKMFICTLLGALYGPESDKMRLANLCKMFCDEALSGLRRSAK